MRDNGLTAASYTPAGEISPDAADAVLASLAEAGIAAYVKPSIGRDVMYVDADAVDRGREIVRRASDDAEFAALVAQLETADDPTAEHPWPAAEDLDDEPRTATAVSGPIVSEPTGTEPTGTESTGSEPPSDAVRAADEAEEQRVRREAARSEEHDHYVPPEPAPAPKLDWISRLAWTGLIGGPVVLVLAAVLDIDRGGRMLAFALLAFVAGFLTLVFRMKDRPPIDDTPDDGAVV
jgi:hypothetical protein